MNRRLATAASLVAVAATMGLSACSSSSTGSSSSGSSAAKPIVGPATLTGMQTAVTLDTKTIGYLMGLGVTVAGNGKAHGVTLSDGAAVAFPITGGTVTVYTKGTHTPYVEGMINHVGSGITLTAGSKSVKLTDFLVNPGTSMLSGTVDTGSGTPMTNVPLFFLDGSRLTISGTGPYMLDGTKVTLLPSTATTLESFFGATGKIPAYTEIGVAHIVATA